MKKHLTCSNGHRWELPIDGGLALAVAGVSCPECGAPAETLPPQMSPIKAGAGDAAVETETKVHAGSSGPASVDTTPSQAASHKLADASTLPPPVRHLANQLPPALLDHPRYAVMALLGAGGMGAVYKAEHRLMDRIVALKVIRRNLLDQSGAIERFEREVKAAARLSHPNIVMAFDAEAAGDVHFLVMEFIEGVNLGDIVGDKGSLSVREACDYVHQALLGLQHAHERGMVHRDLKPHNLMRTQTGGVKILDFGLARFVRESAPDGPLTQFGTVMGTADFVAPEQATNAHDADIRADIYSLGCTLYFLLTGKPPFENGSAVQKILQHLEAEPPAIESRRSDIPAGLPAVLRKMMAKLPADRYQSPAAAAEALAPFTRPTPKSPAASAKPGLPQNAPLVAAQPPTGEAAATPRSKDSAGVAITFTCEHCGKKLKVRATQAGKKVKCPQCGEPVPIPFGPNADIVSAPAASPPPSGPQLSRRATQPRLSPPRRMLATIAALTAVLLLGGVIYVATDRGRIKVQFHDEDVQVAVLQGGEEIAVLDRKTGSEIRRRSGKYEIVLKSDRNDVRLSRDKLTLTRGGEEIVEILREDAKLVTADNAESTSPTPAIHNEADRPKQSLQTDVSNMPTTKLLDETAPGPFGEIRRIESKGKIWGARLWPDHRRLLIDSEQAGLQVWDLETGTLQHEFRDRPGYILPGGRRVLYIARDGVGLWNLDTGEHSQPLGSGNSGYTNLAISQDGSRVLISSSDGSIRFGDLTAGTELARLKQSTNQVNCVAISPDGRYGLAGRMNGSISLLSMQTYEEVREFKGHSHAVFGVTFSKDGELAIGGSYGGGVRIWDVQSGEQVGQFNDGDSEWNVDVSPDGKLLVTATAANGGAIALWDFRAGKKVWRWKLPAGALNANFSPDGQYVTAGLANGPVYVFRVPNLDVSGSEVNETATSGTPRDLAKSASPTTATDSDKNRAPGPFGEIRKFEPKGNVYGVLFSPNDRHLLVSTDLDRNWKNYVLQVWDIESGSRLHEFRAGGGGRFLPDSQRVIYIAPDAIRQFDIRSGEHSLPVGIGNSGFRGGVAITRDGGRALTGTVNGTVQLWDLRAGKELNRLELSKVQVNCLAISADSRFALTGRMDGSVSLLDLQELKELRQFKGHTSGVFGLAFSKDNRFVVTGSYDGTARAWDIDTAQEVRRFTGHFTVSLSPDGEHLLTVGEGVFLWNFKTGEKLWEWKLPAGGFSASFSHDGKYIAASLNNGFVYLFRVPDLSAAESAAKQKSDATKTNPPVEKSSTPTAEDRKTKGTPSKPKTNDSRAASKPAANKGSGGAPAEFRAVLDQACKKSKLPALAAAVIMDGKVVAADAVGVRKLGTKVAVTADDAFHIGSCAKAMTATVIGQLVDNGKLRWDTTLAEAFPAHQGTIHAAYRSVTVEQILAHRGGFPRNPPGMTPPDIHNLPGANLREKRLAFVDRVLRAGPFAAPGTKFEYSNVGYTVLGAIAEQTTNMSWENLEQELLFKPLGMRTVHFGDARGGAQDARPWGHLSMGGQVTPFAPGPNPNDPPAMSPAGSVVHCSIADVARFAAIHLGVSSDSGKPLLKPDTLKRLHTPLVAADGYASGWGIEKWEWPSGSILTHAGATPMNYCVIWLVPDKKFAVMLATNIGPDRAAEPCSDVAGKLMEMFLK